MRMPIFATMVGILALAAGGGYYGLEVYPRQQFRAVLDQALTKLPPGMTVTYKDAHYNHLSRHAMITGLTLHSAPLGEPARHFDLAVDSIEVTNPNFDFPGHWAKAAADPAALKPDTMLAVADALEVKGVILHAATIDMTQAATRLEKPRLYPAAFFQDGMPTWKEFQASLAPKSQPPTPAEIQPVLRAQAAAGLGIAYDSYETGKLTFAQKMPGADIAYEVRKMTGSGFDRGVLKGVSAEGMILKGDPFGLMTLERLTMGTTDVRDAMARLVKGEAISPALLDGMKIGRLEYNTVMIQPPGQKPIQAGTFAIGPLAFAHGLPVSGVFSWKDFRIARDQLPDRKGREAFEQLGLDSVTLNFTMTYDWDVPAKRLRIYDTALRVNELGTLTLAAELTNALPEPAPLVRAMLAHATLRLEDASLTERLIGLAAKEQKADPAAFRKQIAGMARDGAAAGGGPALAAAAKALGDFIAAPRSLAVELSPPAPVPVMSLQTILVSPAQAATRLGLVVSANQP